jgi:MFS family permease
VDGRKGWWVVFGCILALTITAGVGFFSTAVLAESIIAGMSWSELDYAKGITIWGLSAAIFSPLCGRCIDRFGPRRMMIVGICIAAAAEFMLGQVSSLWQFYCALAVAPIGVMCCTYIPVATMVTHWFREKISIATGLAMLGLGVGGGLFPIIARSLVIRYGYESTFTILAGILLLALIPTIIWIRPPTSDEQMEHESTLDKSDAFDRSRDLPLLDSLKTRSFWGLSLGDMLTGMIFAIFNTLLVLYLTNDTGDGNFATGVFSILSFGLGFGILVFGPLGDAFNFRRVLVLCYFLPALGTSLLVVSNEPMMAYSFAVIAGFAGGGRSALFPVAIVNSFGGTHMAAIYGLSNTLFMIGSAIGPAIAGAIYESTGNAQYIYIMGVGVFVVSALLVSLIRDERPPSEA